MAGVGGMRSYKLTQFGAPLSRGHRIAAGAAGRAGAAAGQRLRRLPQRPAHRRRLFRSRAGPEARPCAGRQTAAHPRPRDRRRRRRARAGRDGRDASATAGPSMPGADAGAAHNAGRGTRIYAPSRAASASMLTAASAIMFSSIIQDTSSNMNRCRRRSPRPSGVPALPRSARLKKAAPVDAEHPLMIIGAGGLGLAAVGLCHALYGAGPIVADVDATKRQAALEAGASAVVDPADPDARKSLLAETGGIFSAIDFVGSEKSAGFGLSVLRKGGRLFVVGLFGGSLAISLPTLPSSSHQHCRRLHRHAARVSRTHGAGARGQGQAGADRDAAARDCAGIAGRSSRRSRARPHRADRIDGVALYLHANAPLAI